MQIAFDTRVVSVATGGVIADSFAVVSLRDSGLPPIGNDRPGVTVIDLGTSRPTPSVLQDLVVPLGRAVRGGAYGQLNVIFSAADPVTQNFIGLIAGAEGLPLFVTSSPELIGEARPVGNLTPTERQTLALLLRVGTTTAAGLAGELGIDATTAGNRLVGLAKKGYLQRLPRPRPEGDLYVDPRSVRLHSSLL